MARLNVPGTGNAAKRRPHTLLISVAHGDLRLARYPLAIGHYHGDTIVHAEKRLDQQLGGRLTELFNMYLYPGPKETAEVIHVPGARPPGALVIGLGDVGELQPSTVRDGIGNAVLRHAVAVLNEARNEGRADGPIKTGFSTLLLGTYGGNSLSIEASVSAIIQGAVRANEALRSQGLWDKVRIEEVQIIELYEDVALEAARAADYLAKHPPANLPKGDTLQVEPSYIDPLGNGRFQRPIDPYTRGWWRRIRVTSEKLPDGGEGLRFLALTDRARAEDTLQYTQRGFIEDLVRRAIDSASGADELATVLFKLLIPNSIKDQTRAEADLLLVLDAGSAQYPWELLAERTRNRIDPLALRMGLIRQFQTSNFTQNPQPSRDLNALVIGEPNAPGQAALPGARAEAGVVADLLKENNYDVGGGPLLGASSIEVLNRLFATGYKVLHLAGHGEYVADNPTESGMLLDNGVLSPVTLRNLSPLPELVFINCCHLGRLDDGTESLRTSAPHGLAASVSEQLINMGVKAVVAAGWAVEDRAAAKFAEVFYREMLRGQKFGAAVKEARVAAKAETPNSNTWGAYQCYGNPDFVLERAGDGSESSRPADGRCYTRRDYLERFADIASDATRADGREAAALRRRLAELSKGVPEMWRDGEVLSALGNAWATLEDYEEAIKCYRAVKCEETGLAPLKSVEQLANLLVKYAESLHAAGAAGSDADHDPAALIEDALREVRWLLEFGETSERLSLLGGCYKRKAVIAQAAEEKRKWLRAAKKYYGLAHSRYVEKRRRLKPYPAINWLTYRLLLGESIQGDLGIVEECLKLARNDDAAEPFWSRVKEADAKVVQHLALGDLERELGGVAELYRRAFSAGASPRERSTVTDHLHFLHDMLSAVGRDGAQKRSNLRALASLRDEFAHAA